MFSHALSNDVGKLKLPENVDLRGRRPRLTFENTKNIAVKIN